MSKIKVGMISFAHGHAVGTLNCLLQHPDVEVVGIADENKDRVERFVQQHGLNYYADYKELLKINVEAVCIFSENVHHAKLTIAAAKAGKHILCEKPLGTSMTEMHQMIEVCRQNEVGLMTAFPCRLIPAIVQAKAAVDDGKVGRIVAIKGYNRGSLPKKPWLTDHSLSGGGAVMDHTVHVMDLMNWFVKSEVEQVYAEVGTLFHDVATDDAGMVHVRYKNGVIAVLDPSWSRAKSFPMGGDVAMDIIGTEGILSVNSYNNFIEVYSDENDKAVWKLWGDNMNTLLVDAFVTAIRDGKDMPVTGEDGMKSAAVALAAYESAKMGRPVKTTF